MPSKEEKRRRKDIKKRYLAEETRRDPLLRQLAQWRSAPRFDSEIISETPDEDLEWRLGVLISEMIDARASKRNRLEDEATILRQLPAGARAVYCTWLAEADIFNGGFHQFFFNNGRFVAEAAIEGYEHLGMLEAARVLREALKIEDADGDPEVLWDDFQLWLKKAPKLKVERIRQSPEEFTLAL